jgi:hypothetical protein
MIKATRLYSAPPSVNCQFIRGPSSAGSVHSLLRSGHLFYLSWLHLVRSFSTAIIDDDEVLCSSPWI